MKKKTSTKINHILWATDFSKNSRTCLPYLKEFSDKLNTTNHALYVLPRFAEWVYETVFFKDEDLIKTIESNRQKSLEKINNLSEKTGLVFQSDVIEGIESDQIIKFAEKNDIDMIFAGRRGTSQIKGILIGSTTSRLIRNSDIPVFIVPKMKNNAQVKRILSPIDLGKASLPELKYSISLAKQLDAKLYVAHITEFFNYKIPVLKRDALIEKINENIMEIARESRYDIENIIYEIGEPAHMIMEIAKKNQIDLIVMTTHQRKGIEKFFLGSISEKVLLYSDIPVLILPPTDYELT
ncbi:MAG: universal stress protein [Acidobacteria bacterium]|jgi:nucleotide-binding universal stress UspA family protein|nr:universal stress protein [Acidobacteriota bacterium]